MLTVFSRRDPLVGRDLSGVVVCCHSQQLGLAERVRVFGDVDDVPGLLATAHLFVHPSKSESLSNAILEAMAEGLPVVASRVGGNPEIVENDRTGLLVSPGRLDELASALRRLLDDASLRGRFGGAGLQTIRDRCAEGEIAGQYESIFRRVVSISSDSSGSGPNDLPLCSE